MTRVPTCPAPLHVRLPRWTLALLLVAAGQLGLPAKAADEPGATAIFAGGCFWCMEADFDKVPGVLSTTSGYTGGRLANPSYEQVSAGGTGHLEAVLVRFDPMQTSYAKLLEVYWPNIDPLTSTGQFCDVGSQYRSAIFYADAEQQRQAEASKAALQASGRFTKPVVTEILPAGSFYPAEEYHQNYYQKNPLRYRFYRTTCGRDARLAELWGEHK
ncbi:peptide-methionine (S)-S-oxide reductase MsrA [Pseudomonas sp. GCM10022188]|uniref:peptide-methionine (S)-S-oxide reductase MsrA n=1 Tax=Pseudomonas TaxID=286 RepID=UPI001E2B668C|nr:peptide-methionine (S)-S-oxide reductase MsrA [Pseudomonas oryzagri]MCC6076887.1 peptide-methionine (S)-S-oxide reductase MsrA [Pseudomonas oryzagri]